MKLLRKKDHFLNFLFFAILACLINLTTTHTAGYATAFSDAVYAITIPLLLFFAFLHYKGYTQAAKISSALLFNLFFFTLTYHFGLRSLIFAYYFPFIVSYIYMFRLDSKKREVYIFFFCALSFIAATFIFCSMNGHSVITEEQLAVMYKKNFWVSFIMAACYFYAIFNYLIEQKTIAEEASQSRARFLSIMSHELRTPLNGIIGTINLMSEGKEDANNQTYLSVLKSSSEHLLHLVNNVLDYSKAAAGKMELSPSVCRMDVLLHNISSVFKSRYEEKGLQLKLTADKELQHPVLVDDVRLVQVLTNLLSNALKFTEKGSVELKAVCISKTDGFAEIEISVSDTGIGLTPEQQKNIFESFTNISNKNRQTESTGLGLSISKMIIETMESKLLLESELGIGSRFYFHLTVPLAEKEEETIVERNTVDNLEGMQIMIAEDNPINMMVACKFLKKWKANIIEASNGLIAQQLFVNNVEADLLLLDLQMPEMNGYQLMQWLKEQNYQIPVIAFTANMLENEERQHLYSLGFTDMLSKPFAPDDLLMKIKKALANQQKNIPVG